MKSCIYFKPRENQSFEEIKQAIDIIIAKYSSDYSIDRIVIETNEYNQLDTLINKEINNFECLIINEEIQEEFYQMVFNEFLNQKRCLVQNKS